MNTDTAANVQGVKRSEEGYLCYAFGETDKPVAQLVQTTAEVGKFLQSEWFGQDPADMSDDNREIYSEAMAEIEAEEWDSSSVAWEFEIGGVAITKVFFYTAASLSAITADRDRLREALADLHADIQGRIDDGARFNPGTMSALHAARKALEPK